MNTNSISNVNAANAYQAYSKTVKPENAGKEEAKPAGKLKEDPGVIYEPNTELIAKLKADSEARTAQFRNLVRQLMAQQGNAYGQANDMWKFLAEGNFTVDAETRAQAQKDIAEDGYWGVEQTSDRIIEFANALTGGDPSKIEEMRSAFRKGFDMATKAWGKELPDISQRTYDAVMKKFDALKEPAEEDSGEN